MRRAMAATVLSSQKPKRAQKKNAGNKTRLQDTFSTRCLNAMVPGELYRSRELAARLDITIRRVANAMSSLVSQGRVKRLSRANGVGVFQRIK